MAKACPQCGHPIDDKKLTQKIKETVHDIPQKIIDREGHDPHTPEGFRTKVFFFGMIPFTLFVIFLMPQLNVIVPALIGAALAWWAIGRDVKE